MNTSTRFLCALPFMLAILPTFAFLFYGPKDEGRRFSDGTRVVCHNVEVKKNGKDSNRIAGTAAGAVVGGLLGNQVGKGDGRKLATVGGAVAGAAAGRYAQGKYQGSHGDRVVERRCVRK